MNKLQPNTERAKLAILFFKIFILVYALSVVSHILQIKLLSGSMMDLIRGADSNDYRQAAIAVITMILVILCAIFYIMWSRRAYHNLHKAKVRGLTYTEGWASGAWFVPIMNLFAPYKIMRETWDKTISYIEQNEMNEDEIQDNINARIDQELGVKLIGLWWALYLIARLMTTIGSRIGQNSVDLELLKTGTYVMLIGDIMAIGALIMLIKVIQEMMKIEPVMLRIWQNEKGEHLDYQNTSDDILI